MRPGDTVALLLDNRPEFNLVDTAVLHLGAVPFSLGHPATAEQTAYLIANAEPTVLITEHALRSAADFDPVVLVEELDALPAAADLDFEATWRAVGPEDIATIVYTSGTTGVPKGVELAHRVILSSLRGVSELAPVTAGDRTRVHSGDLGAVDEDGYVRILGRKKDIMITSGGKNLAPAALESALESASPLIAYLREPWLPGGDEVTTTLKLRRSHIAAKYAEEIEALYT